MIPSNKLNRIYAITPLLISVLEMLAALAFFAILSLPLFIFDDRVSARETPKGLNVEKTNGNKKLYSAFREPKRTEYSDITALKAVIASGLRGVL